MPFQVKRRQPKHYPMAKSPGFHPARRPLDYSQQLTDLTIALGFLEWQDADNSDEVSSTILTNRAHTGGESDNLLTNDDFSNDGTSWTEAGTGSFAYPNDQAELTAPASGFAQLSQAVLAAGHSYRFVADVESVTGGGTHGVTGDLSALSAGVNTKELIAPDTTARSARVDNSSNVLTVNSASVKKISERDVTVVGTTTLGVAGFQGQREGTLGADVVTNGGFDADSDWTKGTGWSISGGKATHAAGTGSDLSQASILTVGQSYKVTFTVSGRTAGTLTAKLGSGGESLAVTANDDYEFSGPAGATGLVFTADASFDGSIDNVVCQPYSTPSAVYLDGATSDLHSQGTDLDGLTAMTIALQFYGFTLTSKTLLEKSGEFSLVVNADDTLTFTRDRATTDATATTLETISENAWHTVIVTVDEDGYIQIYLDGQRCATTGVAGSGAVVSNTNAIYWGMDAAVSAGIEGVLDEWGIIGSVLTDTEIGTLYTALTGELYVPDTIDSFLEYLDTISGVNVRYWDLTESSGNAIEGTGSGADGVIAGTTTQGVAGKRGQNAGVLGSEVVVNSDFSNGLTGWSELDLGSGSAVDNGDGTVTVTASGGNYWLYQVPLTIGQTFKFSITVEAISGTLVLTVAGGSRTIASITTPGTYTVDAIPSLSAQIAAIAVTGAVATVSEISAVPYTTPHAVRSDGSTSIITIDDTSDLEADGDMSFFFVAAMLGAHENASGRLAEKGVTNWAILVSDNGSVQTFFDFDTTDINGQVIDDFEGFFDYNFHAVGLSLDVSVAEMIGYLDGDRKETQAGSGSRVANTSDIILLNRAAVDRTFNGVMDMAVIVDGVALSDHIHKWLSDRVMVYGD